ncbi:MAG: DUF2127 domain-containing protein [Pegethrix bostrychoides GSE-TBD4-15B]|jgi:uncharacterized membrane protein (DUF2068 family)|uniref:DUF2127 domain-containing protein n=1 Tax=Pegethrix bostrychoides GSE-TBD4-15B TaxID=2839662 RepID=A0A951P7T3_9CYAN|nr:DUF2127 domain-containing protein [Pegethrix bostrychoides GSE-TBD4-15B]
MSLPAHPPLLIRIIALQKGAFAFLLLLIAVGSILSWRNYSLLTIWAEQDALTAEFALVDWMLEKIVHLGVPTLKLVAVASGFYGMLLGTAAVGLWLGKLWADPMFVGLVGLLIPFETYEVIHEASLPKLALFIGNLIVFSVLLSHWLRAVKLRASGQAETLGESTL